MKSNDMLLDIRSNRVKKVILDTDTYNEVDDQFALAYAMLSPERIDLLSVNAAPFFNSRSSSPSDGMLKSYEEAKKIIKLTNADSNLHVYKGSESYLRDTSSPVVSEAAENIINTVKQSNETIYVIAIGAITNVASALLICPEIAEKLNVIWLGGHIHGFPDNHEFNMRQDISAVKVVFNSGVGLMQLPAQGVTSHLITTVAELEYYLKGKNELCDYLIDIVARYRNDTFARSKVIWDISGIASLAVPDSVVPVIKPRPIITDDGYFVADDARPEMIYVRQLFRDRIYADMFRKLASD